MLIHGKSATAASVAEEYSKHGDSCNLLIRCMAWRVIRVKHASSMTRCADVHEAKNLKKKKKRNFLNAGGSMLCQQPVSLLVLGFAQSQVNMQMTVNSLEAVWATGCTEIHY